MRRKTTLTKKTKKIRIKLKKKILYKLWLNNENENW
jgi:hypothetical protein